MSAMPNNRSKVWRWMAGAALVAAVGVVVWFVAAAGPREPSYQGKSLDYWLNQMPAPKIYVDPSSGASHYMGAGYATRTWMGHATATLAIHEQPEDCLSAMKAMGTDALPILLAKLQARDTSWKTRINQWRVKAGIKPPIFASAMQTRGEAISGLEALQPLPESLLQQLRALCMNADPGIAAAAGYVLLGKPVSFGPGSNINTAIPAMQK